jgi:hypothetical protein
LSIQRKLWKSLGLIGFHFLQSDSNGLQIDLWQLPWVLSENKLEYGLNSCRIQKNVQIVGWIRQQEALFDLL